MTKAWKRLAQAMGKVTKDNDVGSVFTTMENNVNSGKRRTSIDLEEQMESKKTLHGLIWWEEGTKF